jgi:DNA polymerase-3 subunit beta
MKITINRKVLLEGLEMVKDSVGKQTALPILKNIKLTAKDGILKLNTNNLSTWTIVSLRNLSIFSEGEALCDDSKLMAIIKKLPEAKIKIETDEKGHLIMECEKSHFRLFTMPPEEFPSEPEIPEYEFFPIGDRFF